MNASAPYPGIDVTQFRGHPVDLEVFNGPLDLLLHLVQKDRIEVSDISISRITDQFLQHLKTLEALNVEIAGEFLVMAATLMRIKSQMLLPRSASPVAGDEGEPLTREGLIQKLLEYRRYRGAAVSLRMLEGDRLQSLPKGWTPILGKDHQFPLRPARVIDLATYLRGVLDRDNTVLMHEVQLEEIRLEEQIEYLLYVTEERDEPLRFVELLRRPHVRLEWIVTFLAMLELMRQGRIVVMQDAPLGEIWIVAAPRGGSDRTEGAQASDEEGPMEGVA